MDGIIYTSSASFQWPIGSKHLVRYVQDQLPPGSSGGDPSAPTLAAVQLSPDGSTVYGFTAWTDNNGLLTPGTDPNQVVAADPGFTFLKASVTIRYRVLLNFFDSPPATSPAVCGAPGTAPAAGIRVGLVFLGSTCYWNNAILYFPVGSQLSLNAFPYPGFVFLGWQGLGSNAFLTSYKLTGPLTLAPRFSPGKRVRFETSPLGLQVLVDRTPTPTLSSEDPTTPCPHNEGLPVTVPSTFTALCRGDFDFAPGSVHLIGAATPQGDLNGKAWLFDSWGNGNGQNTPYTTDVLTNSSDKVIVRFVPGAQASFVTNPGGLKVSIDGRTNWPGYNFVWGLGTAHQVSAAAQQVDSAGRKFTFRGWSNGGPAAQTVTMDQLAVDSGFRITANYDVLSRVQIQTVPSGMKLQVDGTECLSPCVVDRPMGSQVRVTAATKFLPSDSMRLDLVSWSDGGAADHSYTLASDSQTLTATYATSYRIAANSDPANGADFRFDPLSPDMFYPADTALTISADNRPGFRFRRWAGDLAGTYPSGTVAVSGPRSVSALLDRVPYIAPTGIQNAAGTTPDQVVAPGSLIAIQGESLVTDSLTGRVNPLIQTLGNLTVTIADRFLPLVSVSPQQVIAQLPSNLSEGDYTLEVHTAGQPDVSADFSVARNAPGLFPNPTHADGSPASVDNPAKRGETITILGTGFGPYISPVIDGFFPANPPPGLQDSVDVLVGEQILAPVRIQAATGYTGMVSMDVVVTDAFPQGANVEIKVRINGRLSNKLILPTQ